MGLLERVVERFKSARRPIQIDKKEVGNFVQNILVPGIEHWLRRQPRQSEPIGTVREITNSFFTVEEADGRGSHLVKVIVGAKAATGKAMGVLSGVSRKGEIEVHLNGALSPEEYLFKSGGHQTLETYRPERMQPLWSCRTESCVPYGLYSLLIHELTHAADVFQKTLQYSPAEVLEKGEAAYGSYLNDPAEVRAHMQQVVEDATTFLTKHDMRDYASKKPHPNQALVDLALKMSTTWKVIEPHLNPRNKKLILQAVYTSLDEANLLFS